MLMYDGSSLTPLEAIEGELDKESRLTADARQVAKGIFRSIAQPCGHVPGYGVLRLFTIVSLYYALNGVEHVESLAAEALSELGA
jgi:hypothetical protein